MADARVSPVSEEPFDSDDSVKDRDYIPYSSENDDTDENKENNNFSSDQSEENNSSSDQDEENNNLLLAENCLKSRKRKRRPETHARFQRKIARERGLEYKTEKGKTKNAKQIIIGPCSCKMECHLKISNERKRVIFDSFYTLNWSLKNAFIQGQIKVGNKKRTYTKNPQSRRSKTRVYTLQDENGCDQIVCKSFFKESLSVTDGKISLALKRKEISGTPVADRRGKHPPHNKTKIEDQQFLCDVIKLFPAYESHYSRNDNINRKYLSPTLNMSIMYREYKQKCLDNSKQPLSLFMFRHIFNTKFNLHFHAPHTDTCQKCDSLNAEIKSNTSDDRRHNAKIELELHQRKAEAVKQQKKHDILKAKNSSGKIAVLVFDLQKTLPTPELTTGVVYYKRQLWTYNFGIHDEVTNKGFMYVWSENIASRGPQEIGSCLMNHFSLHLPDNTEHLVLYSDACGGQNRNIKMSLMLNYFLQKSASLKIIDQKFFVSGHSFNTCDQDFGVIEKEKKHHDRVFSPDDWITVISTAKKREPKFHVTKMESENFFSSKSLENQITNRKISTTGDKIEWLKIQQIRYLKNKPKTIYAKYTIQDEGLFYEIDLSKKVKGRPSTNTNISLDTLYPVGRPITKDKKKDLLDLLKFIPPECHDFYNGLIDGTETADYGLDEEPPEDD